MNRFLLLWSVLGGCLSSCWADGEMTTKEGHLAKLQPILKSLTRGREAYANKEFSLLEPYANTAWKAFLDAASEMEVALQSLPLSEVLPSMASILVSIYVLKTELNPTFLSDFFSSNQAKQVKRSTPTFFYLMSILFQATELVLKQSKSKVGARRTLTNESIASRLANPESGLTEDMVLTVLQESRFSEAWGVFSAPGKLIPMAPQAQETVVRRQTPSEESHHQESQGDERATALERSTSRERTGGSRQVHLVQFPKDHLALIQPSVLHEKTEETDEKEEEIGRKKELHEEKSTFEIQANQSDRCLNPRRSPDTEKVAVISSRASQTLEGASSASSNISEGSLQKVKNPFVLLLALGTLSYLAPSFKDSCVRMRKKLVEAKHVKVAAES